MENDVKNVNPRTKARYWSTVAWLENLRPDWQDIIDDILEFPFAYCVHTLDKDSQSEHRKDHVHIMIAFNNTTTYSNAFNMFMKLSAEGRKCISGVQEIRNVRRNYDYLIHDTEKAKKQGKYQYPASARIVGNNFDIGLLEQLSVADEEAILDEIEEIIIENEVSNFLHLAKIVKSLGPTHKRLFRKNATYFDKLIKGSFFLKLEKEGNK